MHLPKFLSRSPSSTPDPILSSVNPSKDLQSTPIGASASVERDQFAYHHDLLKWIEDTKNKLPLATPALREEAFQADPMVYGTIFPYLQNVILKDFKIITNDNKLYSAAVEEIRDYIKQIKLIEVFRDDFLNYGILVGHSYRRLDANIKGEIVHLEEIDPRSVKVYKDPWDSTIVLYRQRADIEKDFSDYPSIETWDSWFIPYSGAIKNVNDTYVEGRAYGNSGAVLYIFNAFKEKYNLSTIANTRIGASERIIAMHNTKVRPVNRRHDDYYDTGQRTTAPIDPIILAIFLKRLLLVNSPNLIYVVLSPFLHLISGVIIQGKDNMGNSKIDTTVPPYPTNANSSTYTSDLANHTAWITAMDEAAKNLRDSLEKGGVFTSGPDTAVKPIESTRSVPYQLIKGLIDNLNEEICLGLGLPIALISSKGSELASSRNITQIFNNIQAGKRIDYETVADELITKQFAGKTWTVKTTKTDEETGEQKEVTLTYTYEEIKAHFELVTPDVKDLLSEAQTIKAKAETLVQVKGVGASKSDIQALGEEYGFGLLGLDNYDAQAGQEQAITKEGADQINAILKSCLFKIMQEEGLISASPTDPSGFKEEKLVKKLKEAYEIGKETMETVFEED